MNPVDEIRKAKQNIISLHDVLEYLTQKYGMTDKEAADYLIIKIFPYRQSILDRNKYPPNPKFFGKRKGLTTINQVVGTPNNLFKLLQDVIDENFDVIPF